MPAQCVVRLGFPGADYERRRSRIRRAPSCCAFRRAVAPNRLGSRDCTVRGTRLRPVRVSSAVGRGPAALGQAAVIEVGLPRPCVGGFDIEAR